MNQYLFLFPIREYFEAMFEFNPYFLRKGYDPTKLFEIINTRYRNQGYGISWLVFSDPVNPSVGDTERIWESAVIDHNDRILVAGVTFETHVALGRCPDPDYVLDQLPPHNRLVVGGFHFGDCVDKIAQRLHERGIDTFVDEDTTEKFFYIEYNNGIPLIRNIYNLEALGIEGIFRKVAIIERKSRPWLVQE